MHHNYWSSLLPGEDPDLSWCELRDYQADCLMAIRHAELDGIHRQLVSLPTGTGKSRIFAHLPHTIPMTGRLLVLAHRRELLTQARDTIIEFNPTKRIALEYEHEHASSQDQIIIASLNGLKHSSAKRLQRLNPASVSHIIYDECHHAAAKDTIEFLQRFGVFTRRDLTLIGFTATPFRTDGIELGSIFERTVYHRDLEEMITAGWLAPIRAYRIHSHVDISHVKITRGDFDDQQLQKAINTPQRNALILDAYRHKNDGRPCLVFCAGVHHANSIAAGFRAAGIPTACIHGDLKVSEREGRIAAFKAGELKVLTNFNVLTEGFDAPATSLMILARPTTSGIVLAQAVGRVTRLHPASGKTYATVIEIADSNPSQKTLGVATLFKLNAKFNAQGADLLKVKEAAETIRKLLPTHDVDPTEFETTTEVATVLEQTIQQQKQLRKPKKKRPASPTGRPTPTEAPGPASPPKAGSSSPIAPSRAQDPYEPLDDRDDEFGMQDEDDPILAEVEHQFEELQLTMTPEDVIALAAHRGRAGRSSRSATDRAEPLPVQFGATLSEAEFAAQLEDSDLLTRISGPQVAEHTHFTWIRRGTTQLTMLFKDGQRIEITADLVGQYIVSRYTPNPAKRLHELSTPMGLYPDERAAITAAEHWLRANLSQEDANLYRLNAKWKQKPMSDRQRGYLEWKGISYTEPLTAGEAYLLISDYLHTVRYQ